MSANKTRIQMKVPPPDYWDAACAHLSTHDRVMRRLIARFKGEYIASRGDPFLTLARSIVGQQISVKAAQAVWDKFSALNTCLTPVSVLKMRIDDMRGAGLSARKIEYLIDLALHFDMGYLHAAAWQAQDDEAIITLLTGVRGVGRWTAEMFLMFHLMRPNILPLDDIGLVKGVSQAYFSGEAVTRSEIKEIASVWEPYCSVATWHIWRSLDPLPVAY